VKSGSALVDTRHVEAERLGQRQKDDEIEDELEDPIGGHEKISGRSSATTRYTRSPSDTMKPTT
jgi:hypothetical protein